MNIVLVGAGGTGISSLGFLFTQLGYTNIIGIDANEGQIILALKDAGVQTYIGHGQYNVQPGDLVVFSDAAPHAPEVLQAKEYINNGIQGARYPLSYFQFLGEISKQFETIAIAGTHGKSTTSAMLTYTMSQSDPLFGLGILGALVPQLDNKNYRSNPSIKNELATIFTFILTGNYKQRDESLRKKYRFVIEADEFNRHFLYLDTDYAIILNAELDHSDIYPNEQVYLDTFVEFAHKVKKQVFVLEGEKGVDYITQHGPSHITVVQKQAIELPYVFGDHVQKNASLNKALLEVISSNSPVISNEVRNLSANVAMPSDARNLYLTAMSNFKGLRRRMELLKTYQNGGMLYTDYGHHPTEIKAVLDAFRAKFPDKKLVAIFQPHQARRVLEFWHAFADTMQGFDEAIIYNIYAARENLDELLSVFPLPASVIASHNNVISSDSEKSLSNPTITELGTYFANDCNAIYTTDYNDITKRIDTIQPNEVICTFTAGDLDFKIRNSITA